MDWHTFGLGCIGGLLPDVIRLIQGRYKPELPGYLGGANFWIGLILAVILGGFAAIWGNSTNTVQALACGFSAPEIITKLLSSSKELSAGPPSPPARLRRFWAF